MTHRGNNIILMVGLLAASLALPLVAAGQDAKRPRGVIGLVRLLSNEGIQRELKLTDKQTADVKQVAELLAQVRDGKAQHQAEQQLSATLAPDQLQRLKQIQWQRLGGYALFEREVAATLEITAAQTEQLRAAQAKNEAEHQKMLDFLRRARFRSRQAMEEYKAKYRAAANQRLRAVLTTEQTTALDKLLGKPFGAR